MKPVYLLAGLGMLAMTAAAKADEPGAGPARGVCDRAAADALGGKADMPDDQVKKLTGATMIRRIAPGAPVTMDFRQERITIEVDAKTSKIVRAFCG